MVRTLEPDELRRTLDPGELQFSSTAEVVPLDRMLSQPRAREALDLALAVDAPGYNVFVTGLPGTGRRSVLEAELRRRAANRAAPPDWVYLRSFEAPTRPIAVALSTGRGRALAHDVAALVDEARRAIATAFESEAYRRRHEAVHERTDARRRQAIEELRAVARAHDVDIEVTPTGMMPVPLQNGGLIPPEQFIQLPAEQRAAFQAAVADLDADVRQAFERMRAIEREGREAHLQLDREVAVFAIGHLIDDVKRQWRAEDGRLGPWLDGMQEDVIENLDRFREGAEELVARYAVNVLVSHDPPAAAPVVTLHDCTFYDLFGRIEYETSFGAATTDHRHIRAGAVHRASGGYLLLQAADVLAAPFVWARLKELLRTGSARIENPGAQYLLFPVASLEPEPIDVDITIVLVGSSELYRLLRAVDPEATRLFKVRADFDAQMNWDDATVEGYAAFVCQQVRDHQLLEFDAAAVARVIEHGARLAGDRERLSARLPEIGDLVQEAAQAAARDGAQLVGAPHVDRALQARRRRADLPEHRLREMTLQGGLRIELGGAAVGQVNGLAVADLGDLVFGHPVRITATVAAGDGKVVDIDREAELSGPIHDKGVLILAGLLRHLYCRDTGLALRASLVFEQSYGPVEGDSASGAELFALLSALTGIPVHQRVGVTGSVDQHGRIQPIGAVNEKIEGFFALCRAQGLTGDQGVVIPTANVRHLMLDPEVVDAVREGVFHVWAIDSVDEGIELLTGTVAGAPDEDGVYPEDSFHGRAQARVAALSELARESRRPATAAESP